MQVVFHLGAPCTDDDRLIGSLLKNATQLLDIGTAVPPPNRYRTVMRDTARAMAGRPASPDVAEALMDAILDDAAVDRLVLSDARFVSINRMVIQGPQIWPFIADRATELRGLFPGAQIEFCFGMRDPATHVPALFRTSRFQDFSEFAQNMDPPAVAWSEMLMRLRTAHPDCPVTVWCNEDTPLLWGEIMREIAGASPDLPLDGADDMVETLMHPRGFARLQSYLDDRPPETEAQRRRIVGAFLERYVREDDLEVELDLPGWDDAYIDAMSAAYDDDMAKIARLPGVTLLMP